MSAAGPMSAAASMNAAAPTSAAGASMRVGRRGARAKRAIRARRWRAGLTVALLGAAFGGSVRAEPEVADAEAIVRRAERGPVTVEVAVRPARPRIGDVIRLDLEARAEPGVELLMPEFGEALGRFEIVDFAPRESLGDGGGLVSTQTYRLQPRRSGPQSIPPLRVEFVDRRPGRDPAPEGEDAWEILTERIALEVEPILAEDEPLELAPPHPDLGPRRTPGWPLWAWLLAALGLAAVAAPFVWRALSAARARQRQRSAYEVARAALDELLAAGRPEQHEVDAFYVRLSLIVRSYLEDRFGLRSPELTTQEFLSEMGRSPDLARGHQRLLRDFLEQADLVKFAGLRPSEEMIADSIAAAERFLEETRDPLFVGDRGGAPATEARRA